MNIQIPEGKSCPGGRRWIPREWLFFTSLKSYEPPRKARGVSRTFGTETPNIPGPLAPGPQRSGKGIKNVRKAWEKISNPLQLFSRRLGSPREPPSKFSQCPSLQPSETGLGHKQINEAHATLHV